MIDKINNFFKQLNTPQQKSNNEKLSLEIACSVLLCEVMKADGLLQEEEKHSLKTFISTQFNLKENEINEIIKRSFNY